MTLEQDEVEELVRIVFCRRGGAERSLTDFVQQITTSAVALATQIDDNYQAARIYLLAAKATTDALERALWLEEARKRMALVAASDKEFYTLSHKILLAREIARLSGTPEDEKIRAEMEGKSGYAVCSC